MIFDQICYFTKDYKMLTFLIFLCLLNYLFYCKEFFHINYLLPWNMVCIGKAGKCLIYFLYLPTFRIIRWCSSKPMRLPFFVFSIMKNSWIFLTYVICFKQCDHYSFRCPIFHFIPVRTSSSWLLRPFDMTPVVLDSFLAFSPTRYLRIILYMSCHRHGTSLKRILGSF